MALRRPSGMMAKIARWLLIVVLVVAAAGAVAIEASPWPSALLIRALFDRGGERLSAALVKHVPASVTARLNERYDMADSDAKLDLFYPPEGMARAGAPMIVWVHGGGWVSGSKDQIANYAKVLAGRGFVVVGVDYGIAPEKTYPLPVRQVNAALGYLAANAARLRIDASRIVLAGDSAGAHIAAQLANAIAVPSYAKALAVAPAIERPRLVAAMLYCGPYDMRAEEPSWLLSWFRRSVLWSYSGGRNFAADPQFATASVIDYVTAQFPPTFISAGNGDRLLPQSLAFADALAARGVPVDRLFFAPDRKPALPHEYQFNLDDEAGRQALDRSVRFLTSLR